MPYLYRACPVSEPFLIYLSLTCKSVSTVVVAPLGVPRRPRATEPGKAHRYRTGQSAAEAGKRQERFKKRDRLKAHSKERYELNCKERLPSLTWRQHLTYKVSLHQYRSPVEPASTIYRTVICFCTGLRLPLPARGDDRFQSYFPDIYPVIAIILAKLLSSPFSAPRQAISDRLDRTQGTFDFSTLGAIENLQAGRVPAGTLGFILTPCQPILSGPYFRSTRTHTHRRQYEN